MTDEASVEALFDRAGPVDIVVANAGAAESAPFTRTGRDLWDRHDRLEPDGRLPDAQGGHESDARPRLGTG